MNPDICIHCGASGCETDTAKHTVACPFTTGVWPVDEEDVKRKSCCCACGEPFVLGDFTFQTPVDPAHPAFQEAKNKAAEMDVYTSDVTFTICLGCAALGQEVV